MVFLSGPQYPLYILVMKNANDEIGKPNKTRFLFVLLLFSSVCTVICNRKYVFYICDLFYLRFIVVLWTCVADACGLWWTCVHEGSYKGLSQKCSL